MSGYHNNFIMKHPNTSIHKLKEEVEEFLDAHVSGNIIMAHQELSDVYLSLRNIVDEYGLSMSDLEIMANTTQRVFDSKVRNESDLFDTIRSNVNYLSLNATGTIHLMCHDINYRYIIHDYSDSIDVSLPDNTEYVEVLHGSIYSYANKKRSNKGQSIQSNERISMDENTVILVKTIGYNLDSLNTFYSASYDKSDAHFGLLKRVLNDDV